MKPHPRAATLAAWFDGEEAGEGVAGHVMVCDRCRTKLEELGRVRATVRGQPVAAEATAAARSSALRPVVGALTALAVVVGAIGVAGWRTSGSDETQTVAASEPAPAQAPTTPLGSARSGVRSAVPSSTGAVPAAAPARTSGSARPNAGLQAGPAVTAAPTGGIAAPSSSAPRPASVHQASAVATQPTPLRLGVLVPGGEAGVADAREMQTAAQQVVAAANAAGGVGGQPVVLRVLDPSKPIEGIDALVGGAGLRTAPAVPWMLPADPGVAGPAVVAAEPSAATAGAALGTALRDRDHVRTVTVIVGDGPDAGLRDGLAGAVDVVAVPARSAQTDCEAEVSQAGLRTPEALAVAGSPELVRACLDAATRAAWRPAAGVVVPPSLAYATFDPAWAGLSVRTVLGLPGPMGTDPGATRFRSSTGYRSYRALVTFAATELAIAVARSAGTVTSAEVAKGTWYSDLLHFDGTDNHGVAIARASAVGWAR